MPDESLEWVAPAKINLNLHVGEKRPDGLHDLQSHAVFCDIGDKIIVHPSDEMSFAVKGPFAKDLAGLSGEDNLVMRAVSALRDAAGSSQTARITLVKNLPVAAGVGGGTADAMAALVALRQFWSLDVSDHQLKDIAFSIGADGPLCLEVHFSQGGIKLMSGAGEFVSHVSTLPTLYICLANPGEAVPTGAIFSGLAQARTKNGAPPKASLPVLPDPVLGADILRLITQTRNDLEAPAIDLVPSIAKIKTEMASQPSCLAARMSGSGATVFGVFLEDAAARQAAHFFQQKSIWAAAGKIL